MAGQKAFIRSFDRCLGIYVGHFDAREKFRMQYQLRRHDGEYRWIDDIGSPRYAHDGSFLGYSVPVPTFTTKEQRKQSFAN